MAVKIEQPTELDEDVLSEEQRRDLAESARRLREAANWVVRKKQFVEIIQNFEAIISETFDDPGAIEGLDDEQRAELEAAEAGEIFLGALPTIVGTILADMGETELSTAEQAAFYLISAYPSHIDAAESWLDASEKNQGAFERLLKADKYLGDLYDDFFADEEEDGDWDDEGGEPGNDNGPDGGPNGAAR
ncbi:MAG TPA: hypothetical protein VEH84_15065 [Alphaproteobacteria bacterium]|nr:hypothetical protein [Alphaproteobacteria bacterium]